MPAPASEPSSAPHHPQQICHRPELGTAVLSLLASAHLPLTIASTSLPNGRIPRPPSTKSPPAPPLGERTVVPNGRILGLSSSSKLPPQSNVAALG